MKRVVIANDAQGRWYIRGVRSVERDSLGERVYRCDHPIGTHFKTPEAALKAAKLYLAPPARNRKG